MNKYIIKYKTKVNGTDKTTYHENITPNTNNSVMNVYVEHVTEDRKKAKVFYDQEEAQKVCAMFSKPGYHLGGVIKK